MPEEAEVETKELQETIEEMREERAERVEAERRTAWTRWISLGTALLAVVAAVGALQSGTLVNEALVKKNESVLHQAQASDQWAYYQAKGIKGELQRTATLESELIRAAARAERIVRGLLDRAFVQGAAGDGERANIRRKRDRGAAELGVGKALSRRDHE